MKNSNTGTSRKLVLIMSIIGVLVFFIAKIYYRSVDASVDPRIYPARELYKKYNSYTQAKSDHEINALLDSIHTIYASFEHYKNSFEVGVLYNNKAAILLNKITQDSSQTIATKDSLLDVANYYTQKSIDIYENWLNTYSGKSEEEIHSLIKQSFISGLSDYTEDWQKKYLKHRVKEILNAVNETDRRLSVSYTNLGVIYGRRDEFELAAKQYKKALDYWDRNLTAENNLNALLDRPIRKRGIIEKLFPPPRK